MHRTRRLLMVAFVATALAADRVADAAPAISPPMVEAARRFAGRLVVSLRRTMPAVRMREFRQQTPAPAQRLDRPAIATESIPHFDFSPFHFRLPPPSF